MQAAIERLSPTRRTDTDMKYAAAAASSASSKHPVNSERVLPLLKRSAIPVAKIGTNAASGANRRLLVIRPRSLNSQRAPPIAIMTAM